MKRSFLAVFTASALALALTACPTEDRIEMEEAPGAETPPAEPMPVPPPAEPDTQLMPDTMPGDTMPEQEPAEPDTMPR